MYESTAYLEVIGKERRIPLKLVGSGLAPVVFLNTNFLSMDKIFVSLIHRYEVVAYNKGCLLKISKKKHKKLFSNAGPIPANVSFVEQPRRQPLSEIKCNPPQQALLPDEYRAFVLEFSSNREGGFLEDAKFKVSDSPDLLTVTMT